jgi:hypothetical protein
MFSLIMIIWLGTGLPTTTPEPLLVGKFASEERCLQAAKTAKLSVCPGVNRSKSISNASEINSYNLLVSVANIGTSFQS